MRKSSDMSEAPKVRDRLFIHSASESGESAQVVRLRGDQLELGEVRPLREGQPLHGEMVKLSPVAEQPRLFDVEVLADPRALVKSEANSQLPSKAPADSATEVTARKGPAKVASDAYRAGWEAIFGGAGSGPDRSLN